jgi:hypothetical protein
MLESREREEREREKEMRSRSARSWRAGFGGGRGYFAQEGGDLYRRITGLWKTIILTLHCIILYRNVNTIIHYCIGE